MTGSTVITPTQQHAPAMTEAEEQALVFRADGANSPAPIPGLARREAVLNFWFGADRSEPRDDIPLWLDSDEKRDAEIRTQFQQDIEIAAAGGYREWLSDAHGSLALILLLDEMAIRAFRGDARGFDISSKSIAFAYTAIARGFDMELSPKIRMFLYLPLMRSELLIDQENSVKAHERGGLNTQWAVEHREIIRRFGRFPTRNKIYDREPTTAELEFLQHGGSI